jgi:hypothetical protein
MVKKYTIYEVQFENVLICKFENVTIRIFSARRSPLEIEDSTIPKKSIKSRVKGARGVLFEV